MNWNE